jgi:hypothetical protein
MQTSLIKYDQTGKPVQITCRDIVERLELDMPASAIDSDSTRNFESRIGVHYTCMIDGVVEIAHEGVKCSKCEQQAYGKLKIKILQLRDENGVDVGVNSIVAREIRDRAGEYTTWCPEHAKAVADEIQEKAWFDT